MFRKEKDYEAFERIMVEWYQLAIPDGCQLVILELGLELRKDTPIRVIFRIAGEVAGRHIMPCSKRR